MNPHLLAEAASQRQRPAWARLITPSQFYQRHVEDDAAITALLRAKDLDVRREAFAVDADELAHLELFPVLFTPDLTAVTDERQLSNLQEYVLRGGFIYVDACANRVVTPSFRSFQDAHLKLLSGMVDGAEARVLEPNHSMFRAPYPVGEDRLMEFYRMRRSEYNYDGGTRPCLYAFYDDDRIFAVISLHFLRCTWRGQSRAEETARKCVAANIHTYGLFAAKLM